MSNLDIAEKRLKDLLVEVKPDLPSIESEEDSKIKIINRMFTECLGWQHSQFSCEKKHDCGYSDYVLKIEGKPSLVVESKRIGILGIESAVLDKHRTLKINGSSLKRCSEGIQQAFRYASEEGIPVAVVTDGITWIVFQTWSLGSSYKEKEAYIFPSFDALQNSFSTFYELLSYEHFIIKTYRILFDGIHNNRKNLSLPLKAPIEAMDIKMLKKSPMAYDLDKILNGFFTQLTGDNNSELMTECFVESNESRIADYSLEKITSSILNNVLGSSDGVEAELTTLIQGNVRSELPSDSDLSVFIVGPTGSGKTTYLNRFFSKILPNGLRQNCLTMSINCLSATGDEGATTSWITEKIISSIEERLFDLGYPAYDDLLGMYFSHYQRMSDGIWNKLYVSDKDEFNRKFSDLLDGEVNKNREGYLEKLLNFAIKNRKRLPIIIVDNTDEFSLDFKIKVFQLCNAYRRNVKHCMLIFPVTDKSAWSFSKTDIFTIHQSKSFFLPTPSPREVFRKRIDYLNKKLVLADIGERKEYMTENGIRIELKDVTKFAQVLEDVFVENNFTAKTLGELTNYNIRSIMNLSKRIITSPVMKIEDLITSYVTSEPINYTKFIDALIRGDYEAYRISTGDDFGVISTFKVNSEKPYSPLLILRILALLKVAKLTGKDVEERHLTVQSITEYFEAIGIDAIDIQRCLAELVSLRLVEPFDPSENVLSDNQKLAVTYKGLAHYDLSTKNSVYFYQMALTTPISDPETVNAIKIQYKSKRPFSELTSNVKKQFADYLIKEDSKFTSVMDGKDHLECQQILVRDIKAFGVNKNGIYDNVPDNLAGVLGQKIVGKISQYDSEKDIGYILFKELNNAEIVFKLASVEKQSIKNLYAYDVVYCTLKQAKKSIEVRSIDSFVEGQNEYQRESCVIKNYDAKRCFGFVYVGTSSNEAFFHKSAFPHNFHEHLKDGIEFEAEIRLKEDGKFQVRRCIKLIK